MPRKYVTHLEYKRLNPTFRDHEDRLFEAELRLDAHEELLAKLLRQSQGSGDVEVELEEPNLPEVEDDGLMTMDLGEGIDPSLAETPRYVV